jgi:hypothetical protein
MRCDVFDQLREGPHLAGFRIYHNEMYHHLQINGRVLRLTPTEYRLCMCLLRHFEDLAQFAFLCQAQPHMSMPNVYVSFQQLQNSAGLAERSQVTKHLNNARGKLRVHGIAIICVNGCGYTLAFPGKTAEEQDLLPRQLARAL